MVTIKRFEDLECWQEAKKFVRLVYRLTKNKEFGKDFGLANQITRNAVSSMANIAEGFHRKSNRDFMKFLDYSRASVAETLSHAYAAFDQGYVDEKELKTMKEQADIVWRKVNNFIAYLNRSRETIQERQ
ncbi:MAG: four helix bundle protein [Deltaproteobacteria bacterium]|nr:four helix bundle protein [Deltaproteobacteria bacterium]